MAWQAPNLARVRFENLRPVRRVSAALALAAAALTAWNVATWHAAGAGAHEKTAELDRLSRETAAARSRVATLERDLAAADLEAENRRTGFLNARIDERVFSWNLLLDRLVETLPAGVRLRSLSPDTGRRGALRAPAAGAAPPPAAAPVELAISGEAQNDEALLELVDRLFADPRFGRPDLARQATRDDGVVVFDLTVAYRPDATVAAPPASAPAAHAPAAVAPAPGAAAPAPPPAGAEARP